MALYEGDSVSGKMVGRHKVENLQAPNDLVPKTVTVSFQCDSEALKGKTVTVVADPDDKIYELTEVNNSVAREL